MKDALLVPRSIPFFSHDRFASKVVFSNQLGINSPHPQHQVIEEERAGEIMRFYIFSILESFFPLQHSLTFFFLFFNFLAYCFSKLLRFVFPQRKKELAKMQVHCGRWHAYVKVHMFITCSFSITIWLIAFGEIKVFRQCEKCQLEMALLAKIKQSFSWEVRCSCDISANIYA